MIDYTTVPKVRAAIGSTVAGEADAVLARLITAVSRQIDRACNRPDGFAAPDLATPRLFAGSGTLVQRIDECVAITLVEVKVSPTAIEYDELDALDWIAFSGSPDAPDFNRIPYTGLIVTAGGGWTTFTTGIVPRFEAGRVLPTVRVTARWGYAETVPPDIENAAIIQVARVFKRGGSAFAESLASSDVGALQFHALAPEVESILTDGRYIRPRV